MTQPMLPTFAHARPDVPSGEPDGAIMVDDVVQVKKTRTKKGVHKVAFAEAASSHQHATHTALATRVSGRPSHRNPDAEPGCQR